MHQIRREKRTTISEVIVPVKRNIKQNRNFEEVFKFSVKSSNFLFNNFKTKKFKLTFKGWIRPVCHLFQFVIWVSFCQLFVAIHPVKRIVAALSFLSRCLSLFLPHLRTLAQEKRSENSLPFGTGGPSLFVFVIVAKYNIFPWANNKASGEAICSRSQCALSGFWARWIWLRGSARYVIMNYFICS